MANIGDLFLFAGALFIFIASLGIVRMPDLLLRMHASAKAGTLGAGLILLSAIIHFSKWSVTVTVLMAIFFLLVTAPVALHLIARAAFRHGIKLYPKTNKDKDSWLI
jgi:multicomponent Na+:H+ antiporter subunit G